MNSNEYIEKVKSIVSDFDGIVVEDILSDLRDYFENGKEEGKTEEELIEQLGSPEGFCDIVNDDAINNQKSQKYRDISNDKNNKTYNDEFFNKKHVFSGDLSEIVIDTDIADINMIKSDKNEFEITGKGFDKEIDFDVKDSENRLYIKLKKKKRSLLNFLLTANKNQKWTINIYFTTQKFDVLNLKTVSGDVKFDILKSAICKIKTVSGDFSAESLKIDSFGFKSVSGDAKISEINSDTFEFDSVSGDLKGDFIKSDNIKFKAISGDIKVKAINNNLSGSTVSGDIVFNCEKLPEKLKAKTVSGDINVEADNKSDFEYELKTLSGDIKSNLKLSIDKKKCNGKYGTDINSKIYLKTLSGDISFKMNGVSNE
ncbi:MAG: DUF4097 domain-containing protein [Candidatus Muirbacterium halophilum]|nr:DUF4097 domain-containing protein [Candidatus Muirbacterium halophilum]MCK9474452.1 DUF4097 domain-containing protein [Candidatus Muirbacterium halophilum]